MEKVLDAKGSSESSKIAIAVYAGIELILAILMLVGINTVGGEIIGAAIGLLIHSAMVAYCVLVVVSWYSENA
ncbi:hypothetical protein MSG28_003771 [Choristoneura fumiferana]|uniref:Uncharacterized protein n=1 Tax=Choristoneura fumiferana TaxID=7141 RepID=A0ACC0KG47_CHOFU|nr:hypothetical protein MSG28_003771 [Choristoneura fumiferana]